jgi:hypothetical protein
VFSIWLEGCSCTRNTLLQGTAVSRFITACEGCSSFILAIVSCEPGAMHIFLLDEPSALGSRGRSSLLEHGLSSRTAARCWSTRSQEKLCHFILTNIRDGLQRRQSSSFRKSVLSRATYPFRLNKSWRLGVLYEGTLAAALTAFGVLKLP